ncbi:MAG: ribonuclease HII [Bacteroidetes bacterium]|nr:ribonuclease HII [Bacteroidota bacterium]
MLETCYKKKCNEAGLDEAGRGCLAGPVFAAAVILPDDYYNKEMRDSKMLNEKQREILRLEIEKNALCFCVMKVDEKTIDSINILKSSILAMHKCIEKLKLKPGHLLIDGNYFLPFDGIEHKTIVKGDNKFLNIAAASILAKTYRDEWMKKIGNEYPQYNWAKNKGYATKEHVNAINHWGLSPYHRRSFTLKSAQLHLL